MWSRCLQSAWIVRPDRTLWFMDRPVPYLFTGDQRADLRVRYAVPCSGSMRYQEDFVFACKGSEANVVTDLSKVLGLCFIQEILQVSRSPTPDAPGVFAELISR